MVEPVVLSEYMDGSVLGGFNRYIHLTNESKEVVFSIYSCMALGFVAYKRLDCPSVHGNEREVGLDASTCIERGLRRAPWCVGRGW